MKTFGNCIYVGVSNNWRRLHGIRFRKRARRYPHERKDLSKWSRVKYHSMKRVGCDDALILRFVPELREKGIR